MDDFGNNNSHLATRAITNLSNAIDFNERKVDIITSGATDFENEVTLKIITKPNQNHSKKPTDCFM